MTLSVLESWHCVYADLLSRGCGLQDHSYADTLKSQSDF